MKLTDEEKAFLAEPVYDAYRLGKYGEAEYLPMWHELEIPPTETPEHRAVYAAAEKIIDARERAAWLAGAEEAWISAGQHDWSPLAPNLPRAVKRRVTNYLRKQKRC